MLRLLLLAIFSCSTYFTFSQELVKEIKSTTQKDLVPEGIVVDSRSGLIYISSIAQHKIVVIDNAGNARDFIKPNAGGYLEGLGMKIDKKRNLLWAVSNEEKGDMHTSQLHAYDLSTGESKQNYIIKDTSSHLFNDLIIGSDGKIYCTDTFFGAIYQADPETKKLKLLIKDAMTAEPNGIVMGKNNLVYIATYKHGLISYNLATRKLAMIKGYKDSVMAFSLDGLDMINNTIYGVYNGDTTNKTNAVVKYDLDPSGTRIISEKIIDKGNSYFQEPTTLSIANNLVYVVANSNLGPYYANKQSVAGIDDKLSSVIILVYRVQP